MAYVTGGTPVTGAKGQVNFLTDRLKYNLDFADVYEPARQETPWLTFLLKLSRKPTDSLEPKSFSNDPAWINYQFYAAGAGTWASNVINNLAVDDGNGNAVGFLRPGLLCRVIHASGANDTVFVITNVDSQNQIDIRALGANVTNIADNDKIQVLGTAMGSGSSAAPAVNSVLAVNQTFCQDFEDPWSMEDTAEAEGVFGPDEWNRLAAETLKQHKTSINRSMLLSTLDKQTVTLSGIDSGSVTLRTTYGIVTFAQDNSATLMNGYGPVEPAYNAYDYSSFIDHMEQLFALGSQAKVAIVGSSVLGFFSKIGSGSFLAGANVHVMNEAEVFGLAVTKIKTPFGVLNLFWDKSLRGSGFYKDYMVAVDMDYVKYRPFIGKGKNFDTHLLTNTQDQSEIRIRKYAYRTVAALEPAFPAVHGLFIFS